MKMIPKPQLVLNLKCIISFKKKLCNCNYVHLNTAFDADSVLFLQCTNGFVDTDFL